MTYIISAQQACGCYDALRLTRQHQAAVQRRLCDSQDSPELLSSGHDPEDYVVDNVFLKTNFKARMELAGIQQPGQGPHAEGATPPFISSAQCA